MNVVKTTHLFLLVFFFLRVHVMACWSVPDLHHGLVRVEEREGDGGGRSEG